MADSDDAHELVPNAEQILSMNYMTKSTKKVSMKEYKASQLWQIQQIIMCANITINLSDLCNAGDYADIRLHLLHNKATSIIPGFMANFLPKSSQ